MLKSPKTLFFVGATMGLFFLNQLVIYSFTKSLRRFEKEVEIQEDIQASQGLTINDFLAEGHSQSRNVNSILPPRERVTPTDSKERLLGANELMERPVRVLIDTVNSCPHDMLI